jgi:hypothetical protein
MLRDVGEHPNIDANTSEPMQDAMAPIAASGSA